MCFFLVFVVYFLFTYYINSDCRSSSSSWNISFDSNLAYWISSTEMTIRLDLWFIIVEILDSIIVLINLSLNFFKSVFFILLELNLQGPERPLYDFLGFLLIFDRYIILGFLILHSDVAHGSHEWSAQVSKLGCIMVMIQSSIYSDWGTLAPIRIWFEHELAWPSWEDLWPCST